jgi:hypothetical protein
LIVVDDSPDVDHEIFTAEELGGAEWVLISDDSPLDEQRRDELIERFQVAYQPGGDRLIESDDLDEEEDEEDVLEPDELDLEHE